MIGLSQLLAVPGVTAQGPSRVSSPEQPRSAAVFANSARVDRSEESSDTFWASFADVGVVTVAAILFGLIATLAVGGARQGLIDGVTAGSVMRLVGYGMAGLALVTVVAIGVTAILLKQRRR